MISPLPNPHPYMVGAVKGRWVGRWVNLHNRVRFVIFGPLNAFTAHPEKRKFILVAGAFLWGHSVSGVKHSPFLLEKHFQWADGRHNLALELIGNATYC